MAGTVEGVDVWHCTPCNGFLVDRSLVLGEAVAQDAPLHHQRFERVGRHTSSEHEEAVGSYVGRVLSRLAMWTRGAQ